MATICGFVNTGAEITKVIPVRGSGYQFELRDPGPWFDGFREHRLLTGRGRPWVLRENAAHGKLVGVTVPNVLATRYAGADLAAIWSPEHKIVLERQLWIAVLKAQRDLGIDVPDGVVEAYEDVVDKVDLESIAARERVTRHDVKARIEEFSALAGHEHIHKGMTSRDLTENVEQLQVRQSLDAAPRPHRRRPWPGWPGSPPSTRPR